MSTLKIGLLAESVRCNRYVEELVRWAARDTRIRISHFIIQPRPRHALRRLPARAALAVLQWAERDLLRSSDAHRDHHALRDLHRLVDGRVQVDCDQGVEHVRSLGLDLIISCGTALPRAALLNASRLGVIAFLHGNENLDEAGLAGFWECYERRPQTSFAILKLGAGGAQTLMRGHYRTRFYYSLNQANVYKKSVSHLKRLLTQVAPTGELPPAVRPAVTAAGRGAPRVAHCLVYGGKLLARVVQKAIGRLPNRSERFGISVVAGKWDQATFWQGPTRPPPGRYWADPFLWTRGSRTFCFVEDLDRRTRRGHISVLEVRGTDLVERGVALKEPFHLSFPFLFEYQGELYMCPETSAAREVRVYRCTEFPLRWQLAKILMREVSAADVMLFEKAGRWWMLANIDESGAGDHCSELYLFSADSPLAADWVAHPQNPILVDSIGGRNGGLIRDGERLFRLGQCQGFDRYGEALRVFEITEVSPARYVEQLCAQIRPDARKGVRGTHHLSTDGTTTVVDYV